MQLQLKRQEEKEGWTAPTQEMLPVGRGNPTLDPAFRTSLDERGGASLR